MLKNFLSSDFYLFPASYQPLSWFKIIFYAEFSCFSFSFYLKAKPDGIQLSSEVVEKQQLCMFQPEKKCMQELICIPLGTKEIAITIELAPCVVNFLR